MLSQTCRHGKIYLKYLAHLQHFILTSRIYNASPPPLPPLLLSFTFQIHVLP